MPVLDVQARGFSWRHTGRTLPALLDLDLSIPAGEHVLLLGASGSGKSTLLHALAGVLGSEEDGEAAGTLQVGGAVPVSARGHVGLVLQDPDSQVVLARVGDDVAFACENLGVDRTEIWHRVHEALDAVGLNLPLDHPTSQLSGGQKQRLALAGIIAMRPGLILLDEPTANLDPDGVVEVRDAVTRVARHTGATIVVVEHRVAVWRDFVDRAVVLGRQGTLLADGAVSEVLDHDGPALAQSGIWVPGIDPVLAARPARGRTGAETLLSTSDLAVGRVRGRHDGDRVAADIHTRAVAGQALAVTGPNGAGKSTLALTLAGLLPAISGTLTAHEPLARGAGESPYRWRSRQLLTRIGTVFQDPEHQFLTARVRDELAVGPHAARMPKTAVHDRVDDLLARLRLDHVADANPFTLSGGEKRRLSVATVLAAGPRVLVLDEPTFGQDRNTWAELVDLLGRQVDEGAAAVLVTHDTELVRSLADAELRLGTGTVGAKVHA